MSDLLLKKAPAANFTRVRPPLQLHREKPGARFVFPSSFKWGAASSAFQIEGAAESDGRGPSVWDAAWARDAELFYQRHSPAVAADFYHHYREDVAMMKALGLTSFRYSISWSRVLPDGRGRVNEKGMAFYERLVDCLLENGIEPLLDLYHWDLPQALMEDGGFLNDRIVADFEAYATLCYQRLSDRVKQWSTLNEPSAIDYYNPFCAANADISQRLIVDRNSLLMHFAAVRAFRQHDRGNGQVGAVIAYMPVYAATHEQADIEAAARQQAMITDRWLDPMLAGQYSQVLLDHPHYGPKLPKGFLRDCGNAYAPMDYIGLNYYTPAVIAHRPDEFLESETAKPFAAQSDYGFVIYPPGLFDSVMAVSQRYDNPIIYITENGMAHDGTRADRNLMDDDDRIAYIREHLREVHRCLTAGADVRGYYYWSIMDTFEAMSGYRYRFGLVNIDFDTLKRTPRKSWSSYQKIIHHRAVD
ncbi:MAG: family 1 glycosylhydrolase [Phycisphaerales bacterium]|jgi:beta-glucosidase|nr:family 1 glycosylhydrolase [Phycisphaerales bacterium]